MVFANREVAFGYRERPSCLYSSWGKPVLLRSGRLACSNKEGRPDLGKKTIPDVSSTNTKCLLSAYRLFASIMFEDWNPENIFELTLYNLFFLFLYIDILKD